MDIICGESSAVQGSVIAISGGYLSTSHSGSLDLVGSVVELCGGGSRENGAKVAIRSFRLLQVIFHNIACVHYRHNIKNIRHHSLILIILKLNELTLIVRQRKVFSHSEVECLDISGQYLFFHELFQIWHALNVVLSSFQ